MIIGSEILALQKKMMKIGVVFPQNEFSNDPVAIRDYAQTAEALGYQHILAYDHVLGANPDRPGGWQGPYTYKHPFHELLLLFTFMAAVTTRIEFVTGILILPQRETALAAKQVATLDLLSGGRLRLGVGIGWNKVEYIAQNKDFHTRGKRIEEQVDLLRKFWQQELVTFSGRWHEIPDAGLNPLPIQRPIPIWFGGHADAVLERTARLGDGWLPDHRQAADAQPALDKLDSYLQKHGRSWADLGLEWRLAYGQGDPDLWEKTIRGWEKTAATHFSLNTMYAGRQGAKEHIAAIQDFAQKIGLTGA
jgi:probable F420-dependent oxidoreductase